MRVGMISDIHGNLQALDVVLEDIGRRGLDAVYCLGDLVGYAPFPNEVIERIRAAEMPSGNSRERGARASLAKGPRLCR